MKPIYSHICATAKNNTIGLKGQLPWNIPEDLEFFKQKTLKKICIMGRKTFESLGKPLPHRLNVVITRNKNFSLGAKGAKKNHWIEDIDTSIALKKPLLFSLSLKKAVDFCGRKEFSKKYGTEVFIIGGEKIYRQSMAFIDRIYLTRIHKNYKGDAFYPVLPSGVFSEVKRVDKISKPSYSFITYERI